MSLSAWALAQSLLLFLMSTTHRHAITGTTRTIRMTALRMVITARAGSITASFLALARGMAGAGADGAGATDGDIAADTMAAIVTAGAVVATDTAADMGTTVAATAMAGAVVVMDARVMAA